LEVQGAKAVLRGGSIEPAADADGSLLAPRGDTMAAIVTEKAFAFWLARHRGNPTHDHESANAADKRVPRRSEQSLISRFVIRASEIEAELPLSLFAKAVDLMRS